MDAVLNLIHLDLDRMVNIALNSIFFIICILNEIIFMNVTNQLVLGQAMFVRQQGITRTNDYQDVWMISWRHHSIETSWFITSNVLSFNDFSVVSLDMLLRQCTCLWFDIPDSKSHGANMGPTWVLSAPDGPHVGPMNLAIKDAMTFV